MFDLKSDIVSPVDVLEIVCSMLQLYNDQPAPYRHIYIHALIGG